MSRQEWNGREGKWSVPADMGCACTTLPRLYGISTPEHGTMAQICGPVSWIFSVRGGPSWNWTEMPRLPYLFLFSFLSCYFPLSTLLHVHGSASTTNISRDIRREYKYWIETISNNDSAINTSHLLEKFSLGHIQVKMIAYINNFGNICTWLLAKLLL